MNNNSIRDNNRLAKVLFFFINYKLFYTLFQPIDQILLFSILFADVFPGSSFIPIQPQPHL